MIRFKEWVFRYRYPLILIFLPLIVFWRNLLPIPGRVFFGNDAILSFYTLSSIIHQLREGSIPLWDPYTFFGVPLLTRPDSLVFYLPLGLTALLGVFLHLSDTNIYVLMELVTVLHFSLAGLGAYFFLRKLKISEYAAFIGGLIYMFNGGIVAFANTTGLLISISYFPWVLLSFDYLIAKPSLRRTLIFSLVFAQPVLTFAWTSAIVYHSIFLFFYFWYLYFSGEVKGLFLTIKFILIGLVLAALVSAVVVLPALEVPLVSDRANIGFSQSAYGGNLRPRQLFDFLMPYLTAKNYGEREVLNLYFETLTFTYVGLATLLLIIPAFFRKHRRGTFFLTALVFSLLFLLGGAAPVFGLFYLAFYPIMKPFSEARLASYIPQFLLAVLAALGVENLTVHYAELKTRILSYRNKVANLLKLSLLVAFIVFFRIDQILWYFIPSEVQTIPLFSQQNVFIIFLIFFGLSTLCFYFLGLKKPFYFKAALFLTLFLDLFLYAEKYPIDNIGIDPARLLSKNSVVRFITAQKNMAFYRSDVREIPYNYAPALAGINHIDGYLVYLPKVIYNFYALVSRNPRNFLADRIAGIRYYVTETPLTDKNYDLVFREKVNSINQSDFHHLGGGPPTGWVPVPINTEILVYENKQFDLYPRLVTKTRTVDDAKAKDLLSNQLFNPEEEALVSAAPPLINQELTANSGKSNGGKVVDLPGKNYEKNFFTQSSGQALLVTNLPFNNDWKVSVDGRAGDVIRTNLAFMGVDLPAGQHRVSFYYVPKAFYAGLIVSLTSLIFVLLTFTFLGRGAAS